MARFAAWLLLLALARVACSGEPPKYHMAEVSEGGRTYNEVYDSAGFAALTEYAKKLQPVASAAVKEAFTAWMGDVALRKTSFPLTVNPAEIQVRSLGAFEDLAKATERLLEADEQLERREEAKQIPGGTSTVQQRLAQQREADMQAARKLLDQKLAPLKAEAGLGAPPLKGLLRDTLKDDPRYRARRIERAARLAFRFMLPSSTQSSWAGGNGSMRVIPAVMGLAMFAAEPGGGQYRANLDKIKAHYTQSIADKEGKPLDTMFAGWFMGFRGIFLAEYYAHYPSPEVRAALEEEVKLIHELQNEKGCWHHGYGARREYEVHAAGLQCLATLGMARSFGIPVKEDQLKLALDHVADASGRVGYSTVNGHFAPARTAGTAWAYFCCDQETGARYAKMVEIAEAQLGTVQHDHASPALHMFWRGLFSQLRGEQGWKRFWDLFTDKVLDLQQSDGSFAQAPWADADMEKNAMGAYYTTAFYALVLTLQRGNLKGFYKLSVPQAREAAKAGRKAWLGVKLETAEGGVRVAEVASAGPAARWGLARGFVITQVNGKPPPDPAAFDALLEKVKPGDILALTYLSASGGKPAQLSQMALARPADEKSVAGWR